VEAVQDIAQLQVQEALLQAVKEILAVLVLILFQLSQVQAEEVLAQLEEMQYQVGLVLEVEDLLITRLGVALHQQDKTQMELIGMQAVVAVQQLGTQVQQRQERVD
jgi:hypothetical protein